MIHYAFCSRCPTSPLVFQWYQVRRNVELDLTLKFLKEDGLDKEETRKAAARFLARMLSIEPLSELVRMMGANWLLSISIENKGAGIDRNVALNIEGIQYAQTNDTSASRIVHRWPDEIGKPVDPHRGAE